MPAGERPTEAPERRGPAELAELPLLRGFGDVDALTALADRFEQREYEPGDPARRRKSRFFLAHPQGDRRVRARRNRALSFLRRDG